MKRDLQFDYDRNVVYFKYITFFNADIEAIKLLMTELSYEGVLFADIKKHIGHTKEIRIASYTLDITDPETNKSSTFSYDDLYRLTSFSKKYNLA